MHMPTPARDLVALLVRIVVGGVFVVHGLQKFVQWGIDGTAASFAEMGIPAPTVAAWAAALVETLGGAALILGFALPVAGVLLALNMVGALFLVHLDKGFFATSGGLEYVLVLAVAALMLGFHGGGYALDRLFVRSERSSRTA